MEIQHSSFAIFYVNRVLGLAPYLTRRNKKGRIDEIKLSILLCIYSVLVLTTAGRSGICIFKELKNYIINIIYSNINCSIPCFGCKFKNSYTVS